MGWVERLLAIPLFLKLLIANAVLMTFVGAVALAVSEGVVEGGLGMTALGVMVTFVVVTLLLGAALNAILIRLALSPLASLAATADEVRAGSLSARAEISPMTDKPTRRLIHVFNRMLEAIETARERQRELGLRVLQAEERERERLADELYSGTAQTLASVLVLLRLAGASINRGTPSARRSAESGQTGVGPTLSSERPLSDQIREEVARALDEIRLVARRLRPPELDDLGVFSAVEAHARRLREGRDLDISVRGEVPEERLDGQTCLALFRIFQEASTNAVLHSGAEHLVARFTPEEHGLLLEVEDDGRGFDVVAVLSKPEPSFGMTGMRERAIYVGGTLTIRSAPGEGTLVQTVVPWVQERTVRPSAASGLDSPGSAEWLGGRRDPIS